jgi:hypothetical protein
VSREELRAKLDLVRRLATAARKQLEDITRQLEELREELADGEPTSAEAAARGGRTVEGHDT